jgi:methionyl-tRNA formyltransferase
MKIVFFGTPDFAVSSLEALLAVGHEIAAVVTAPDKPSGRGLQATPSAVKQFAIEKNLLVLQPEKLKDDAFIVQLKAIDAPLFIVVAFRMLPEVVWNMPKQGTYNLHASLLPKYRGAAPINWAIINGERETGLTTFKLQHAIDTGDILLQTCVPIEDTVTAGQLYETLKIKGAELLVKTVQLIEESAAHDRALPFVQQATGVVSHAPKLNKETGHLDWSCDAKSIHNRVRGLHPSPSAWTVLHQGDKQYVIKIHRSRINNGTRSLFVGKAVTDNKSHLYITCGTDAIEVLELQAEGRKRMTVEAFLRGFKIEEDGYFE